MNYSQESKKEMCEAVVDEKSVLPLLSALVHTCGTVCKSGSSLIIKLISENPYLYPFVDKLLKKQFGVSAVKEGRDAVIRENALGVLAKCRIMDADDSGRIVGMIAGIDASLVKRTADKQAYLKGAFLGAGSLSAAHGYHLEIGAASAALADDLAALISGFNLSCHSFERKDKHVVYIKRSEDICDFLAVTGATRTMLALTEQLAQSKTRKDANGRNNLELSNMDRTINAAVEQAQAVRLIEKKAGLGSLDEKLQEVARLRLGDDALSYEEIAAKLGISKGSVKYRFKKIMDEAKKYG